MLYLISEGNRDTILQLPWIDKHLDLIRELGYAKVPVDLFDSDSSKSLSRRRRGVTSTSNLSGLPCSYTSVSAPTTTSVSRNYVQLAKLTARTNVGHL